MSLSVLNRGASGGLKPELTVTAPSGSTIDIIQNGIIVNTYTLGANETEHTFVAKVGTYTVRGTLKNDTKSVEIVIDTVGQYLVEMQFKLWLYREGDECEDVTGGWVRYLQDGGTRVTAGVKESNRIYLGDAIAVYPNLGTVNSFNVTKYSYLAADIQCLYSNESHPWATLTDVQDMGSSHRKAIVNIAGQGVVGAGRQVVKRSIKDMVGNYYACVAISSSDTGGYVYNVWLE